MMFGAELSGLLAFGRQLGLALAGAASLWGVVFYFRSKEHGGGPHCLIYEWIARRLAWPLYTGLALAALSWLFLSSLLRAGAHEGIALKPESADVTSALGLFAPFLVAWVILALAGLLFKAVAPPHYHRWLGWFYAMNFLFAVTLISFPAWTGEFSKAQWFLVGHSVHSIMTVGTVLVLDFLYLTARGSFILKEHIFPWFPTVSKVIWIGLGIDFLSVGLVFGEAIALTSKFFFMQTVVGVLVINGVLLSGPLTRRLLSSIRGGESAKAGRLVGLADLSGTVSITSWLTITFVDFFAHLTLRYHEFLFLYLALVALLFLVHKAWVGIEKRRLPDFIATITPVR